MGSRTSSEAEKRLTAAEAKLKLHLIPAQVSFDYFNPYFLSDYIPEHDFYRLLQAYELPIQSSEEMPGISAMYEALRLTQHRYKLKLSLVFFVLHSNAAAEIKAELLYLTYIQREEASVEAIQKLVNNLVDVCLNVSKRLLPGDTEVSEYISKLKTVRKVLFSTLQVHLSFPVTLPDFIIVLTSPQFVPLLTPSSLRQFLLSLYTKHSPSSFSAVRMPLIY
jgi:hypothetical protein